MLLLPPRRLRLIRPHRPDQVDPLRAAGLDGRAAAGVMRSNELLDLDNRRSRGSGGSAGLFVTTDRTRPRSGSCPFLYQVHERWRQDVLSGTNSSLTQC